MEAISKIKVTEEDLDLIGHLNNIKFVAFLENARSDWYAKAGLPYDEMRSKKLGTVILNLDVTFLKEALLGDTLRIDTTPKKLGNKSFVLEQNIFNQKDEHITQATVVSVMFDLKTRKSVTVVDQIARQFPVEESI